MILKDKNEDKFTIWPASSLLALLQAILTFLTSADNWDPGMQEAEEDGHHGRLGPVRQDQVARLKGEEDW